MEIDIILEVSNKQYYLGGIFMSAPDVKNKEVQVNHEEINSLKGTLFSTVVFVGGGILFFIIVLFYFYMMRV